MDPADGFVQFARRRVSDPRASFRIGDAQALPVEDATFDCAVSGLMINFVPDQSKAVNEMRRAARPGATIAAYVWDYADQMQMMRRFWNAAVALNPAAHDRDEAVRFPDCRPEPLERDFSRRRACARFRSRRSMFRPYSRTSTTLDSVSERAGAGARILYVAIGE